MDYLISAKTVSKCKACHGSGYAPHGDPELSQTSEYSYEIGCSRCDSKGKITEKVDLSLESLKDLLK